MKKLSLIALAILIVLPFAIALVTGADASKFWQGMLIQVFIYAIYALSYDLLFGYTGILSFDFFAHWNKNVNAAADFAQHDPEPDASELYTDIYR